MIDRQKQIEHYDELMASRRPNRGVFSCGYDSRFDPFLLDRRPELVPEFEAILRTAAPKKVGSILDIGCGSGLYFPLLARRAERLAGLDFSSEMIAAARGLVEKKGLTNVDLFVGSAEELPFPDESFDLVLGIDVLHHIPDLERALREVRRVLRPGGRFASVEPNVLNPMVFLAHLIPAEERGALGRNWPWKTRRLIKRNIGRPRVSYVFHVTSSGSKLLAGVLRFLDRTMQFWPLRCLGIRMIMTAQKR
jgi:SAM-dependent methyltransferase